jgi:hypothetical protein
MIISCPTWEEFNEALKRVKLSSAGGINGLTYSIMYNWTERIRRQVYDLLEELWEVKGYPDH